MSDALQAVDPGLVPRKSRWPRVVVVGLVFLAGVGWLLAILVEDARLAARRSTDK